MTEERRLGWRQLQLDYKVRAGTRTRKLQQVRQKLYIVHAVLETPKTEKGPNYVRRWWGRKGTKHPAGARWNETRDREIKDISAQEFANPVGHHPNRKVSKTRVKAALLLDSFEDKKMHE